MTSSINAAIAFLTRPLLGRPCIVSLERILLTILSCPLTLTLSPTCLPPRPIYAACIASGLPWVEWIAALGGREFDLIIEPTRLSVRYAGSSATTIWTSRPSFTASLNTTLARAQTRRTLAQLLLVSDHESAETEEMFALVRKCDNTAVISPTPTRASFPARSFVPMPVVARTPSPTSSTSSTSSSASSISRPSSRSSVVSSVSSLASSLPSKPALYVPPAKARRSNPKVFIDMSKKDVTRYSYQGGVSTVLTGGVMLGGPPACSSSWRRV